MNVNDILPNQPFLVKFSARKDEFNKIGYVGTKTLKEKTYEFEIPIAIAANKDMLYIWAILQIPTEIRQTDHEYVHVAVMSAHGYPVAHYKIPRTPLEDTDERDD